MCESLNDRLRVGRPSPAEELNSRPYRTQQVGRTVSGTAPGSASGYPIVVGQKVWLRGKIRPQGVAVYPKYDRQDEVVEILDLNTGRLKNGGIQGVEQLKPVPTRGN